MPGAPCPTARRWRKACPTCGRACVSPQETAPLRRRQVAHLVGKMLYLKRIMQGGGMSHLQSGASSVRTGTSSVPSGTPTNGKPLGMFLASHLCSLTWRPCLAPSASPGTHAPAGRGVPSNPVSSGGRAPGKPRRRSRSWCSRGLGSRLPSGTGSPQDMSCNQTYTLCPML